MALNINLLHQHKVSKLAQQIIVIVRVVSILTGIVVLIALGSLYLLKKNVEGNIAEKTIYQNNVMSRIVDAQEKETAALLFNEKYKQIESVTINEPPYLKYYQTIIANFPNSSESGKLESITLRRDGSATIQITFPGMLPLTKFLTTLETEEFKKNFNEILTSSISFSQNITKPLFMTLNVKF